MAKIKLRIPSLDSVPEELQAFYAEDEVDGGFVLQSEQDEKGLGIGPLSSLRGKLEESQRKENKVKNMLLKKDDDSLWTAEELAAITQELKSLKELNATLQSKSKGDEDVLKQQVAAAKGPLQEENTRLKAENERFRKTVYDAEGDRVLSQVLKIMDPTDKWEDLMRRELSSHIQVEEVDGKLKTQFIDPKTGTVRFSSNRDNDGPMDANEFANLPELRTRYADCLNGDGKVGANVDDQTRNRSKPDAKVAKTGQNVVVTTEDANDFLKWAAAVAQAKEQGGEVVISDGQ